MVAMKRSASVLRSAAGCGDGVRTTASARAAGPRRWVPRAGRLRGAPWARQGRMLSYPRDPPSRGYDSILPWRARHGALVLADGGASCQAHVG